MGKEGSRGVGGARGPEAKVCVECEHKGRKGEEGRTVDVVDEHGLAERLLGLGAGVASVVAGLEATGVVGVGHDLVGLHPRQSTSYNILYNTLSGQKGRPC